MAPCVTFQHRTPVTKWNSWTVSLCKRYCSGFRTRPYCPLEAGAMTPVQETACVPPHPPCWPCNRPGDICWNTAIAPRAWWMSAWPVPGGAAWPQAWPLPGAQRPICPAPASCAKPWPATTACSRIRAPSWNTCSTRCATATAWWCWPTGPACSCTRWAAPALWTRPSAWRSPAAPRGTNPTGVPTPSARRWPKARRWKCTAASIFWSATAFSPARPRPSSRPRASCWASSTSRVTTATATPTPWAWSALPPA